MSHTGAAACLPHFAAGAVCMKPEARCFELDCSDITQA